MSNTATTTDLAQYHIKPNTPGTVASTTQPLSSLLRRMATDGLVNYRKVTDPTLPTCDGVIDAHVCAVAFITVATAAHTDLVAAIAARFTAAGFDALVTDRGEGVLQVAVRRPY